VQLPADQVRYGAIPYALAHKPEQFVSYVVKGCVCLILQYSSTDPMLLPKHTYTGLRAPGRAQCMQVFAYRDKTESGRSRSATSSSAPAPSQASSNSSRRDFIEARQVSLFELFDGENFKFDIPEYQRPYSWRVKQVGLG
jgi:hypothetical protein